MKLTPEYGCRIYNDETGDFLALEPNVDGVPGLLEIKFVTHSDGQEYIDGRLVLDYQLLRAMIAGLNEVMRLNPEPKPDFKDLLRDHGFATPGIIPTPSFIVGQNEAKK